MRDYVITNRKGQIKFHLHCRATNYDQATRMKKCQFKVDKIKNKRSVFVFVLLVLGVSVRTGGSAS